MELCTHPDTHGRQYNAKSRRGPEMSVGGGERCAQKKKKMAEWIQEIPQLELSQVFASRMMEIIHKTNAHNGAFRWQWQSSSLHPLLIEHPCEIQKDWRSVWLQAAGVSSQRTVCEKQITVVSFIPNCRVCIPPQKAPALSSYHPKSRWLTFLSVTFASLVFIHTVLVIQNKNGSKMQQNIIELGIGKVYGDVWICVLL